MEVIEQSLGSRPGLPPDRRSVSSGVGAGGLAAIVGSREAVSVAFGSGVGGTVAVGSGRLVAVGSAVAGAVFVTGSAATVGSREAVGAGEACVEQALATKTSKMIRVR
jgi:hypothetical protein